ncbi:MAG: phage replisome organizer N-terminal domain-containing protein [Paludibacteraceae bacterium]|nr:phage replisome organizer N-terminal domain-containing protein [Paludibacteraceae bacterium]
MSDIKWISIATDIFNNEKILAIESLPDGASIELVWFKLLCLAGTCNENGFLMINQNVPYTDQMMAKYFRIDIGIVQRALEIFEQMNMVEIINDIYMVSNWFKYQNSSELERIRENNRERQQRYRDRQKALLDKKRNVTRDATNNEFCSICNMSYVDVYITVINYLNTRTNSNYKYTTKKNQTLIHARTEEGFTIDDFKTVIDKKTEEWLGTDMERYLRPETLFGTKFEGYLNQTIRSKPKSQLDEIDVGD